MERNSGKKGFLILDVRTPGEFRQGYIEGAVLMNYYDADFRQRFAALDRNATIFITAAAATAAPASWPWPMSWVSSASSTCAEGFWPGKGPGCLSRKRTRIRERCRDLGGTRLFRNSRVN
jgi:hypothetical protein